MAGFMIHTTDDGRIPPYEYLPCGAITPKIGMALYQDTNGNLAIATGTTAPTYISMCERETACTAGDIIPVIRVNSDIVFETGFSAAATALKLGNLVTLDTTGLRVTATTTGGVAEVVSIEGTAIGDSCRVRFPAVKKEVVQNG